MSYYLRRNIITVIIVATLVLLGIVGSVLLPTVLPGNSVGSDHAIEREVKGARLDSGMKVTKEEGSVFGRIKNKIGSSWAEEGGKLVGTNAGYGDAFAMTDIYAGKDKNLDFSAKVNISSGTAMINFGVHDYGNPSRAWYAVNLNASTGVARLFSVGCGSIGAAMEIHTVTLPENKRAGEHVFSISVKANGKMVAKIDDVVVCDSYDNLYAGGYIGFGTFFGNATFSDVQYSVTDGDGSRFTTDGMIDYRAEDFNSSYRWGTWTVAGSEIKGSNIGQWDQLNMSTLRQEPDQNLIFEADMKVTGTNANTGAGLVFGVNDVTHPGEYGWYSLLLNRGEQYVRAFSVNKGNLKAENNTKIMLSAEQKSAEYVHLKIIARANGMLSFYVDGEKTADFYDSAYNGGYIGFYTVLSESVWKNVKVSIFDNEPGVGGAELDVDGFKFDENQSVYVVTTSCERVTFAATPKSGYSLSVNGKEGGEAEVSLNYGDNMIEVKTTNEKNGKEGYMNVIVKRLLTEPYRPKVHITPKDNWMNDPNGLLYDSSAGVYHTFYQYSYAIGGGFDKHWGHAVSKDLVNWEDKGVAFGLGKYGSAWSGSGVVDEKNTSGLFNDSVPSGSRMVCFVTYHNGHPRIGITYSLDAGETWIEYDRPVIDNTDLMYSADFRDPKVIWVEDDSKQNGGVWLMFVGGYAPIRIFSSDNLLDWKLESEAKDSSGVSIETECPDIYPLALNGDKNDIKWVLTGAHPSRGNIYYVGNLYKDNGVWKYAAETDGEEMYVDAQQWKAWGELYATQSFFGDKEDRVVLVSWMNDYTAHLIEDKPWNGILSTPVEATLTKTDGKYNLNMYPVKEVENLHRSKAADYEDHKLTEEIVVRNLTSNVYDFNLTATVNNTDELVIKFISDGNKGAILRYKAADERMVLSLANSGKIVNSVLGADVKPKNGKISVRMIVDVSVVEIWVNGGEVYFASTVFPGSDATEISIGSGNGRSLVDSLKIWNLKSQVVTDDVDKFDVTFDLGSHGENIVVEVESNAIVDMPVDPVGEGVVFGGWFTSIAHSVKFDANTPITTNTTVYAKWVEFYTVRYEDGVNGEAFAPVIFEDIKHGAKTPKFDGTPQREGYVFAGWTPDMSSIVTKSITYVATWNKIEDVHEHNYTDAFKSDEEGHWQECECGEKNEKTEHSDGNGDGKCDACSFDMGQDDQPGNGDGNQPGSGDENQEGDKNENTAGGCGTIGSVGGGGLTALIGVITTLLFALFLKRKATA